MSTSGKNDTEGPPPAADDRFSDVPVEPSAAAQRRSVAKVSHTLDVRLAQRLEAFAFYQRVSESSVIEHSLNTFFSLSDDDGELGEQLRREGAGRRRKT